MNSGHTYKCKCLDEYAGKNCQHSKYFRFLSSSLKFLVKPWTKWKHSCGNIMFPIDVSLFLSLFSSLDMCKQRLNNSSNTSRRTSFDFQLQGVLKSEEILLTSA